jgi:prepilin-type N-terminal cleavage/methylation domain-containing protein
MKQVFWPSTNQACSNALVNFLIGNHRAFTLIELMVTLAILSIMLLIAYMNWLDYLPKYRVNAATDELFTEMTRCKMKAVTENRDYSIQFDTSSHSYSVSYENSGTVVVLKTVSIASKYPGIVFGHNTAVGAIPGSTATGAVTFMGTPPTATFSSKGFGKAGTVYLMPAIDGTRKDRHRAISVIPNGRIKTYKHNGTSWG